MLEDKLLVLRFKRGSSDALVSIYQKYKNDLLGLAIALSHDRTIAEDVLHDVFVSFAQRAGKLNLRTSLKSYLSTCVANRVRDIKRRGSLNTVELDQAGHVSSDQAPPETEAMSAETSRRVGQALQELPYQQREIIILHIHGGMKFREIAESQGLSLNTVQSRYRYGLDRLRSQLNGKVESWKTQTLLKSC